MLEVNVLETGVKRCLEHISMVKLQNETQTNIFGCLFPGRGDTEN